MHMLQCMQCCSLLPRIPLLQQALPQRGSFFCADDFPSACLVTLGLLPDCLACLGPSRPLFMWQCATRLEWFTLWEAGYRVVGASLSSCPGRSLSADTRSCSSAVVFACQPAGATEEK
jgi:hypothetical protein